MIEKEIKEDIINLFGNGTSGKSKHVYLKYKDLIDEVKNRENVKTNSEAIYIILNGKPPVCKNGNDLKYRSFTEGYGYCKSHCQCFCEASKQNKLEEAREFKKTDIDFFPITPEIVDNIKMDCDKEGRGSLEIFNKYKKYLANYIERLENNDINLAELFYIVINGEQQPCKYGGYPKFYTYKTGYKDYCGNAKKCKCLHEYMSDNTTQRANSLCDAPTTFEPITDEIINEIRQYLEKNEYPNFATLYNKYKKYMKNYADRIEKKEIRITQAFYEILNGQPKPCKYGKFKKFNSFIDGYKKFCGTHEVCECLIEDRRETQQNIPPDVRKKRIQSRENNNIKKFGMKNTNQKHFTDLGKFVLSDPIQLQKYIDEYSVSDLTVMFNCGPLAIYDRINAHNLNIPNRTSSSYENNISKILVEHNINFIMHDRTIIKPKEIDIFIPSVNLAIEINGLYHHSDIFKDEKYHYDKWKGCIDKGIQLLSIFEDEIIDRPNTWISKILHICNSNNQRIHARKCQIVELSKNGIYDFVEKYHLQGFAHSKNYYGAFYDNELVAMMSFSNTRNNKEIQMNRFCLKNGVIITGIANRLLKAFVNDHPDIGEIVTYSDNRYSDGGIYEKMGFEKVHDIPPDYSYIHGKSRLHKSSFKKDNIAKKFDIDMTGKTEREAMEELGFSRIWDCGKVKWRWKR